MWRFQRETRWVKLSECPQWKSCCCCRFSWVGPRQNRFQWCVMICRNRQICTKKKEPWACCDFLVTVCSASHICLGVLHYSMMKMLSLWIVSMRSAQNLLKSWCWTSVKTGIPPSSLTRMLFSRYQIFLCNMIHFILNSYWFQFVESSLGDARTGPQYLPL